MRGFATFLLILILCSPILAQSDPSPIGEVRRLASGFRFTEGPAWDGKGALFFSDMPNNALHRWSEADGVTLVRKGEHNTNGIVVDRAGTLYVCEGARRIVQRSSDGKETTIADSCEGRPLGMPNDLWMTPNGGIYFTIPVIKPTQADRFPQNAVNATVCFISPDRTIIRNVGYDLTNANGIVGSSDGKRLYVSDPRAQRCVRYTIDPDGGLSNQQVVAARFSDGLALDQGGHLYTTCHEGIRVFSPAGREVVLIPIPETPANMTFGGNDGRTLFITARTSLYAVSMNVQGDLADHHSTE